MNNNQTTDDSFIQHTELTNNQPRPKTTKNQYKLTQLFKLPLKKIKQQKYVSTVQEDYDKMYLQNKVSYDPV